MADFRKLWLDSTQLQSIHSLSSIANTSRKKSSQEKMERNFPTSSSSLQVNLRRDWTLTEALDITSEGK